MVVVKRVSLLVQVLTITDKSNLRKMHDFVNNLEKIPGKCTVSGKNSKQTTLTSSRFSQLFSNLPAVQPQNFVLASLYSQTLFKIPYLVLAAQLSFEARDVLEDLQYIKKACDKVLERTTS